MDDPEDQKACQDVEKALEEGQEIGGLDPGVKAQDLAEQLERADGVVEGLTVQLQEDSGGFQVFLLFYPVFFSV